MTVPHPDSAEGVLLAIAQQPIPDVVRFGEKVIDSLRNSMILGTETVLVYDGEVGAPAWISTDVRHDGRWRCAYCGGLRSGEQCAGCGAPRMA